MSSLARAQLQATRPEGVLSPYDSSDLYDLVAPRDDAMEAFYRDSALAKGPRLLELACGTGRFAVPLAKAGLEVTGIDVSEAMLAKARQAAEEQRVEIELLQLDMRDFNLDRQFETAMIAANSIMHLLTADDFRRFFTSVARHLVPGGRLLLDCFVPSVTLLSHPGQRQLMSTVQHPDLGEVSIEEVINYDPLTQVADTSWFWSTKSVPDFHVTQFSLRSIFPQELPLLLETNGFRLVDRFGDFQRGPFATGSRRQVCVCEISP